MGTAPLPARIDTDRLTLRPFELADAGRVRELAGDADVARPTMVIPHPLPAAAVEAWLAAVTGADRELALAVTLRSDATLIGEVTLRNIDAEHARAELGYWLGKPYWRCGYCTEAGRAMLGLGFGALGLNRIYAMHLGSNPTSGRVLEKLGMVREGIQRQHVRYCGASDDIVLYGMLRSDFDAARAQGR